MTGTPKKLVVNGRFLTQSRSGVQNYAFGILKALEKAGHSFEIASPKNPKPGALSAFIWEQFFLPRYIKKENAFLLNLCNSAPLNLKQQAITIHDLAFEVDPGNWFRSGFKKWYKYMIPRICRKAELIFTVSEFSKKEITKTYAIAQSKIIVVPNGLPEMTFNDSIVPEGNYVLLTSIENPRKNAEWILEQIPLLKEKGYKLILLKNDSNAFQTGHFNDDPNILLYENCEQAKYFSLLKKAKALIYPSLYEGFGIPILESLSLGTPVIASDLPIFKESFGELPVYFKLNDVNSFKEALGRLESKQITEADKQNLKNKYNFEHSVSILMNSINTLNK